MTARILERLEAAVPGTVASVDIFAGTSTGGIIALALAAGLSPSQCVDLYRKNGKEIFSSRGVLDTIALGLDEVWRADYAADGLRKVLEQNLGDRRLGDLQKDVLIPAFDLRNWRPKFFDRKHDANVRVVDVALATSSAPTYFPAHGWVVGNGVTCYADGGLYANNPSDSAIAYATARGVRAEEIHMISLGTGASIPPQPKDMLKGDTDLDWGYKQWVLQEPWYLFSSLFDGSVEASHYRSQQQLGPRYRRVQPVLTAHYQMDDAEKVDELVNVGTNLLIDDVATWLRAGWFAPIEA